MFKEFFKWFMANLFIWLSVLLFIFVAYSGIQEKLKVSETAEYKIETPDRYYYSVRGTLIKDGQCIVFNDIYDNKPQTVCGSYNYRKIND